LNSSGQVVGEKYTMDSVGFNPKMIVVVSF